MADYFDVMQFLTKTFNIPSDVFTWPNVLFNLIIPMVASIIIWYTILHKRVRILHSSGINFGLAVLFSIFMLPFINFIPASFLLIIAIVAYFLLGGNLTLKKMIFAVGLGALVFFGYPILVNLISAY